MKNNDRIAKVLNIAALFYLAGVPIYLGCISYDSNFVAKGSVRLSAFILGIILVILAVVRELRKDAVTKKDKDELLARLDGTPYKYSKNADRRNFDKIFTCFRTISHLDNQLNVSSPVYTDEMAQKIAIALSSISQYIEEKCSMYFGRERETLQSNFMVHIENNEANNTAVKRCLKGNRLYYRNGKDQFIEGVLYLLPELSATSEYKWYQLGIPLYDVNQQLYSSNTRIKKVVVIPGAPAALHWGNHTIGNLNNTVDFADLSSKAREEVRQELAGRGVHSLLSFRIPDYKNGYCGVLNIANLSQNELFSHHHDYTDTFYSQIYPTLKLAGFYLSHYKNYLIQSRLTSN